MSVIASAPHPLTPMSRSTPDEDGVFTGYASLFNVTDLSGDMVLPGAFRTSLARRGTTGIKMLYQHDPSEPLGLWLQISEDAKGLRVVGQLHPEVAKSREVMSLVGAGILDGLSIGFRTVRARTDAKTGIRRLAEIDLWEISIVTFPMLPGARILGTSGQAKAAIVTERLRHLGRQLGTSRARLSAKA